MLAPDDDDTHPVLSFSLASDIVELVIFTTDDVFLQTLREAVGGSRRLWHVPSADKVSDLLLAGQVGILVLDVQALPEAASVFVTEIKRQFPELVVIVASNREPETSLANLISAGIIYRFIHKPMSPARAKLFADAAVKKYEAQRSRVPVTPDVAPPANRRLLIIGAVTAALIIGIMVWARHGYRESGPSADNALDPYPRELAHNPTDAARTDTDAADSHERLLARAENALLEERLDEAATAIDAARKAGADGGRVAFLTAQLAKSRAQVRGAMAQARLKSDLKSAAASAVDERTNGFLDRAAERIKEGHLIEPEQDNARFYVGEALQIDPNGNATQGARETLARALLAQAHVAIDRRDFAQAASLLDAAGGIAAESNVQIVQQLLGAARKQAEIEARDQLLKTAEERRREDRLVEPADDSANTSAALREVEAAANQQHFLTNVVSANELTLVKSVKPVYPARAERAKTEGWVELDFTVTEDGDVKSVTVRAANPAGVFDSAAIAALSQWRYKPVLEAGKPAPQHCRIRIRFALTG
jgi:TonB family protein